MNRNSHNKEERFLTRTHIADFSNRLEEIRYDKDYHWKAQDIVEEYEEFQVKEPYEVSIDGRYGVYDEITDTMLVPAVYDEIISPYPEFLYDMGYFIVRRNGKYGIVRSDVIGTEIYPCMCDKIISYDYNKCIFQVNGLQGFMEIAHGCIKVTEILPAIYDSISDYDEKRMYLQLCKDGKVGLYGAQIPLPPIYDGIYIPQIVGWIKVKLHGRWGYIDRHGHFTEDIGEAFLYVCSKDPSSIVYSWHNF